MTIRPLAIPVAILFGLMLTQDAGAAEDCFAVLEPVTSLSYGSRYTEESQNRSDIDLEANTQVNAALGPIDDFIVDLTEASNLALEGGANAATSANCVVAAIAAWAEADALSDLRTMNAQISSPSRIAGMAFAWRQASTVATEIDADTRSMVEAWFNRRGHAMAAYFDDQAPPNASRNNLRAWAGLAAASVAEATGDMDLAAWAANTVELVACQANADGALPLEMARGARALHYQVHSVGPLVVTAAMLFDDRPDLFSLCDGAIHRIVGFVPMAFADLSIAERIAGERQTYQTGEDDLASFELAWAEAYLSLFVNAEIAAFVEAYRPLSNSKLGGDQSLLW